MIDNIIFNLLQSFEGSFVNQRGEFIAHEEANEYFNLEKCKDYLEIKCKVLEWFSRGAYKTAPYEKDRKNKEFNDFMLEGINEFLGTNFTSDDMELIYTKLGNNVNRKLCVKFVNRDYDTEVLKEE